MDGNGLKNKSSNNSILTIHKMPLLDRIVGLFSSLILTIIPIVCLLLNYENKISMIILLIALILFSFVMYLSAFKTYISFDIDNNKITISEGLKREELSTSGLMSITVETDAKDPYLFSLNYNFIGYSKKDYGWSTGPSSRVLFGSYRTQRSRLENFCEECNRYLKK
jgi:hypothetical protein